MTEPTTLQEAILYFANPDRCLAYLIARRWPDGVVVCPTCGSKSVHFIPTRRLWECNTKHPRKQFSIKIGTIFEDSPLGLDKWLAAAWMITSDKNGISSYELAKDIGVTQKTAWFMLHRLRKAMQTGSFLKKFSGEVEVDETFIGGKARNMHISKRAQRIHGTGGNDKVAVMGFLERGGEVRTTIVENRKKALLQDEVRKNVSAGAALYSDALASYDGLDGEFFHQVVDHAVEYVRGNVHTNGLENFWSLVKRALKGTYVSVEPFHLFRYLDEQAFRYNHRKDLDDAGRTSLALSQIVGKRLMYKELIGKAALEKDRQLPN
ncbi:MAG TPA: IS1595 family transposase [Terriglobia bacterium]|nr:IS1595 family transposase [Terriglobia bacterium]